MNAEISDRVWNWLLDSSHMREGLLTRDSTGLAVVIAQLRACPRSLGGHDIVFCDDIFVFPEAMGSGAADAVRPHPVGVLKPSHFQVKWAARLQGRFGIESA